MADEPKPAPPVPTTFAEYLRSFGPGIVVVLTWLGAGDVVDMAVAGANYGYALMWVLVLALGMRFVFVSLIARYQLCNPRGEGVLDGLARVHPWFAPGLLVAAFVMGHVYMSYMTVGTAEVCVNLFQFGRVWQWAIFWNGAAFFLVYWPRYDRLESVFKVLLALLSVSFVGSALWVGFRPADLVRGLVSVEIPAQRGNFSPATVAIAMIGAVGGSLMNLAYPYFLEAKGWRGPQYRRVQFYDFLVAVAMLVVLNLSVWILGAQLLFPLGRTIKELHDLPQLLSDVLGEPGRVLFYLGLFAAIYTSVLGHAAGLAYLGSHAYLRHKAGERPLTEDFRKHPLYRVIVAWCLITPLVWTLPGMPKFAQLTPVLAGGLWRITASRKFIGDEYRNRWWENILMAGLFALAVVGAADAVREILKMFTTELAG
jgi:Mn2+/Fe2+ NRAMP family transporter